MKIAFLSPFYPYRGGIAQFSTYLYKALQKKTTITAFNYLRQYPSFLFPGKSQFVPSYDDKDAIPSIRVLDTLNPFSYYKTAKIIASCSPDILLMRYWMPFFAIPLGIVAKLLKNKMKIISIVDNVIPHEKHIFDNLLTKFFLKQNHGFILLSDATRKDLLKLCPNAKFVVHPHPEYNQFKKEIPQDVAKYKFNIPQDGQVILFFGIIRKYKGLDILIKAMDYLPNNIWLLIGGEIYESEKNYLSLIRQSLAKERIICHFRYISDDEVPFFFSCADVCVLPYRSATQSGVLTIANNFNLPVIATNVGALPEVIKHNETGLIVQDASPIEIANAIKTYFKNNLKETFQKNLILKKNTYTWDSLAECIINFAKSL